LNSVLVRLPLAFLNSSAQNLIKSEPVLGRLKARLLKALADPQKKSYGI